MEDGAPPDFRFRHLPKDQQARQYRSLADEYLRLATRTADLGLREEYLALAAKWKILADALEPRTPPPKVDGGDPLEE